MSAPSPFKLELIKIARAEADAFENFRRGDQQLEDRIECYRSRVGLPATLLLKQHYSAAFISWCMRSAGASDQEFAAAAGHWQYAECAARNAQNGIGLFWARQIESYAPQMGDLIHFNREGGEVDYTWICNKRDPYKGESGIVVDLKEGEAVVVIGNLEPAGNIGLERFALTQVGLITQRTVDPFVCVIEVAK